MNRYFKFSLVAYLVVTVFSIHGQQPEQEEIIRNNLIKFKSKLQKAKPDIIREILFEIKSTKYYNDLLKNYIPSYEEAFLKTKEVLDSKENEYGNLSVDEDVYHITGRVETTESGNSLVNTGNERFGIKGRYKVGEEFSGNVRRLGETVSFDYIGGRRITINKYEVVNNVTSSEYKENLGNEINRIKTEEKELFANFIKECLEIIDYGIKENEEILMDRHYKIAENRRKNGEFQKELDEYNYIKQFNENYLDIKDRIITANKEIQYIQAAEFASGNKFLDASNLYFDLAFPTSFKDSYKLFRLNFEKHLNLIIKQANQSNDILQYLTVFNLIDEKGKASGDPGSFGRMKKEYIPDFQEFVFNYYNPQKNLEIYNIVPEGSFISAKSDESIDVEGFLISKEPVNYALLESFKIINGGSLNLSYNKYTSFEDLKIPGNILRQIASWIKTVPVTAEESEYLNCDGWESINEKSEYLKKARLWELTFKNRNANRFIYNYINFTNLHKISFESIANDEFRKSLEEKADAISDERDEDIEIIKDSVD